MNATTTNNVNLQTRVENKLAQKAAEVRRARERAETKKLLEIDFSERDQAEVYSLLRKATIEQFDRNGRKLLLNPYHVYKLFYTERYAGLINHDSERLPEQQFTAVVVNAIKLVLAMKAKAVTPQEKAAWLEVLGEEEEIGTKQVTLQTSHIAPDCAAFNYFREKYGL